MSAITRVLMLGLLSYLMVGCRGGGDPMANIVSVSPTGTVGVTTGSVEFSADVDAPGSFTLAWDFNGGTFPGTSTELTPDVVLLTPDTYVGSLELLIDDIVVDTFPFTYIVAAVPEVTAVAPDGSVGLVRALVDFEATIEGDFDSLAWTFDDGATLLTQDEAIAQARLLDPGIYEGTVTPTLDSVSGSAFPFEYTVDTPVAPTWTVQDVALARLGSPYEGTSITLHEGKLAVAFTSPDGLALARALTASPCCPADWSVHIIEPKGAVRSSQALISQTGRLLVAYRQQEDGLAPIRLWVAVAQVEEPASAENWWTMDLEAFSGHAMLSISGGTPVMATGGLPKGLNFLIAQQEHPESAEDWLAHSIRAAGEPGQLLVNVLSLRKADEGFEIGVLPGGETAIYLANTETELPSDDTDWSLTLADDILDTDRSAYPIFASSTGPQLLYTGPQLPGLVRQDLIVLQSTVPNPTGKADWMRMPVVSDLNRAFGSSGFGVGGVWAERACFLRPDRVNNDFTTFRQVAANILGVAAWEQTSIDQAGQPGTEPSIVLVGAGLAVAYLDDSSGMLRVATTSSAY